MKLVLKKAVLQWGKTVSQAICNAVLECNSGNGVFLSKSLKINADSRQNILISGAFIYQAILRFCRLDNKPVFPLEVKCGSQGVVFARVPLNSWFWPRAALVK
jgi:hypothetical protein